MARQNTRNTEKRSQKSMTQKELQLAIYRENEVVILEPDGGFDKYVKTPEEKGRASDAKCVNKNMVTSEGYNPGYVMNTDRSRHKILLRFAKAVERNRIKSNFILKITA